MSVAAISGASAASTSAAPVVNSAARVADGDYKAPSVQSASTKDGDGDYKPLSGSAAGQSTAEVQASLTSLKVGG